MLLLATSLAETLLPHAALLHRTRPVMKILLLPPHVSYNLIPNNGSDTLSNKLLSCRGEPLLPSLMRARYRKPMWKPAEAGHAVSCSRGFQCYPLVLLMIRQSETPINEFVFCVCAALSRNQASSSSFNVVLLANWHFAKCLLAIQNQNRIWFVEGTVQFSGYSWFQLRFIISNKLINIF